MELKILLNMFGRSTIGSKDELELLAINLLKNSPYRFDRQTYLSNILELRIRNYGGFGVQNEMLEDGALVHFNAEIEEQIFNRFKRICNILGNNIVL